MNAEKKLDLAILWHMHQPDFRDHATGEFVQPWVYLHAIKDYSDMAAHLEAHPGIRVTLNFTPVLLDQLDDYTDQFATGRFRDPLLRLLAQPNLEHIGAFERNLVLAACFKANHQKLIDPYPAYKRLLDFARLAQEEGEAGTSYLSAQYFGDLLSWYHLSWMGETVRRENPLVPALIAKAHNFSHDDRIALLKIIKREVSNVVPRYRKLYEAGRIELTTTPEYHPIGPLLLSFESALEAAPGSPLPQCTHYPGGHERAHVQTQAAQQSHARRFGRQPRGMWPAEGAVSTAFADLLARAGCEWIASGEGVLVNSLKQNGGTPAERAQYLYRPYRLDTDENSITCFFRDDRLSDLIGFEYAKWHGKDAAEHFVASVSAIATEVTDQQRPVVSVILDGENAWEYYPYNGYYFLDELYGALEGHGEIATTTFAKLLDDKRESARLPALVAGSWVYGNLATWIGSADKNRAWDLLCAAKRNFDSVISSGRLNPEEIERSTRQLADCEASDWCWWFGDYNPAESVVAFDALFRSKLTHLYDLLKLPAPGELSMPVSHGKADSEAINAMRRAS
jgi:alpha-amylase/alpha-mannosidase (GH57 family)